MTRSFIFSRFVLFIGVLFCGFSAQASHIVGTVLTYTHVSGDDYKISLFVYGDCGPESAASAATLPHSAPQVCIYNTTTYVSSISLGIDSAASGMEVDPLCTGDTTQCTNTTSTIPGVKKYVYSAVYTLPSTSTCWRFVYGGYNGSGSAAGRASAITNISGAGATEIQLTDTLDNTSVNNSTPTLTLIHPTMFCINQHDEFNPLLTDPESDSLSVSLTTAGNGTGAATCTIGGTVTYTGNAWTGTPVSATEPMQVLADSFSVNGHTGLVSFHPDVAQRGTVVFNIQEYRGGNHIGTSQGEMTFLIVSCGSVFPCMYTGVPLEVPNAGNSSAAELYPNPTAESMQIKTSPNAYSSYTVTNAVGQVMLQQKTTGTETNVNVAALPAGIYYVTLKGDAGNKMLKFVKL